VADMSSMSVVVGDARIYSIFSLPCSPFPAGELHGSSQKQLLKYVPNSALGEFFLAEPFLDLLGKGIA
jgi:hypothetical protein